MVTRGSETVRRVRCVTVVYQHSCSGLGGTGGTLSIHHIRKTPHLLFHLFQCFSMLFSEEAEKAKKKQSPLLFLYLSNC